MREKTLVKQVQNYRKMLGLSIKSVKVLLALEKHFKDWNFKEGLDDDYNVEYTVEYLYNTWHGSGNIGVDFPPFAFEYFDDAVEEHPYQDFIAGFEYIFNHRYDQWWDKGRFQVEK